MRSLSPRPPPPSPPPAPLAARHTRSGSRYWGAWPDAGSSRPNGCCLEPGDGTEKGGAAKEKEERTARPIQKRRDPWGPPLCRCRAPRGQRVAHKGAGEPEPPAASRHRGERAARGRCGAPRPQPRPRPAPAPPRSHCPLRGRPHPYLCDPPPRLGYFPSLSLCSPPYSRPVAEVTFLRSAAPEGQEPTGSASPLHALDALECSWRSTKNLESASPFLRSVSGIRTSPIMFSCFASPTRKLATCRLLEVGTVWGLLAAVQQIDL
uniref:proline-rich protein HaeIII subfamily 1-like n=1 Tax=Callithrix jacchus TaxID=9483 RepID=UPI0023DCF295|nr:proline-rich protein HaeIII subfamily 1-like [Callithrix jacchus]